MLHITMLLAVQLICALGIQILNKRITVMFYCIISFRMGSVSVVGRRCCTCTLKCCHVVMSLRYYITYPVLNYYPFKLSLWADLIG